MLTGKNACKYFFESGPNKCGKGSYSSLCVNKLFVPVLSTTIHFSVFLKGNPHDHPLYHHGQCHREGEEAVHWLSPSNLLQGSLVRKDLESVCSPSSLTWD